MVNVNYSADDEIPTDPEDEVILNGVLCFASRGS